MILSKSINVSSEPYILALSSDEFLHLYRVICSVLYEDHSDKFLVKLESLMIDML